MMYQKLCTTNFFLQQIYLVSLYIWKNLLPRLIEFPTNMPIIDLPITDNGNIYSWGAALDPEETPDLLGRNGDGRIPQRIPSIAGVIQLAVGQDRSFALLRIGQADHRPNISQRAGRCTRGE